jgi:hypothetical protein
MRQPRVRGTRRVQTGATPRDPALPAAALALSADAPIDCRRFTMTRIFVAVALFAATFATAHAMGNDGGAPPDGQCRAGMVYDKWKQRCVPDGG